MTVEEIIKKYGSNFPEGCVVSQSDTFDDVMGKEMFNAVLLQSKRNRLFFNILARLADETIQYSNNPLLRDADKARFKAIANEIHNAIDAIVEDARNYLDGSVL